MKKIILHRQTDNKTLSKVLELLNACGIISSQYPLTANGDYEIELQDKLTKKEYYLLAWAMKPIMQGQYWSSEWPDEK